MKYIFSLAYIPPISFFVYLLKGYKSSYPIYIEKHENYLKQTFRNRTYIASSKGLQSLSIPIQSNNGEKILTSEVQISSHGNWIHNHIHAIQTSYGSSPFFEYYKDEIFDIINSDYSSLWDLSLDMLYKLLELIHIDVDIRFTDKFEIQIENAKDYRFLLNPKKDFNDTSLMSLDYYDTFHNRSYSWLSRLSIIDLLFNMGPETILILDKANKHKQNNITI